MASTRGVYHHPRVADALGVVEATVELPVLLAKRWNRNNNDELAVSITVSDHCGTPYITSVAEALGPAWTVGEGFFAGKKWKGGFLSIPDRTGALKGSPKNHFLLHRRASTTLKLRGWWRSDLLEADVQEPKTVQMDAQHDAVALRVFACNCHCYGVHHVISATTTTRRRG